MPDLMLFTGSNACISRGGAGVVTRESFAEQMHREVKALIHGKLPQDTYWLFTPFYNWANLELAQLNRFVDCFANPVANLTSIPAMNRVNGNSKSIGCVPITPDVIISCKHDGIGLGPDAKVYWVDAQNNLVVRYLESLWASPAGHDYQLYKLSAPLPDVIQPLKIMGSSFPSRVKESQKVPLIFRTRDAQLGIFHYYYTSQSKYAQCGLYIPDDPTYTPWLRPREIGTSGSPIMVLVDGEFVLLSTFTTPTAGPAYYQPDIQAEIQQGLTSLGSSGTLQIKN